MRYFKTLLEFYNSKEWKECKEYIRLKRLNEYGETIDEFTGEPILNKRDIVFHHKIELTLQNVNDPKVSLNPENIMIVSFKSHNEIHRRFGKYERKVYLVVGAPCSGKSSWVESVATKEDLIFDFDKLWDAISINPLHIKNSRLTDIAMALRTTMFEQIQMRSGSWVCCYVLTTEPYSAERNNLCIRLGVDSIITMDATRSECLKRLNENPNGRDIELYTKLINKFYDRYQEDGL